MGSGSVGGLIYQPIANGTNLNLTTEIHLGSRKLAAWAIADPMRTEFIKDALKITWRERRSLRTTVIRSDHGTLYTLKD